VPLLFYIFDRLSERSEAKTDQLSKKINHADEDKPEDVSHGKTEGR